MDSFVYNTDVGDYLSLLDSSYIFERGLPGQAIIAEIRIPPAPGQPLTADALAVNRVFVDFLHSVIARYGPLEPGFVAEARWQQNGWVYILDARTPTPLGDVPPEDIIGAFEVREGELLPDSYRPNPTHRIFSERGLFQLTPYMEERLLFELMQLPGQ